MNLSGGGIKGTLTHKWGPLPVWGWAGVAAGGVVAFQWWKSRSGGTDSGTDPNAAAGQGYSNDVPFGTQTQPSVPTTQSGATTREIRRTPGHRPRWWYMVDDTWYRGDFVNPKPKRPPASRIFPPGWHWGPGHTRPPVRR